MTKVLTQTKVVTSSETEISPIHRHFSNQEPFLNQPATLLLLKFDADDEVSSVRNDTLHVYYANSDCLSTYSATTPRQDPAGH